MQLRTYLSIFLIKIISSSRDKLADMSYTDYSSVLCRLIPWTSDTPKDLITQKVPVKLDSQGSHNSKTVFNIRFSKYFRHTFYHDSCPQEVHVDGWSHIHTHRHMQPGFPILALRWGSNLQTRKWALTRYLTWSGWLSICPPWTKPLSTSSHTAPCPSG